MPQDAAASGAQSDADSSQTGDQTDAGSTGAQQPMTQEDIDKIVGAKVAQKLKSYGDLNDLKKKAAEYDKVQTANQSETERLQARIAELERQDAERETERKQERVQSATVREAARLGFRDPADAYRLLNASDLEFDGDDQPSNLPKLLTSLLKDKPYLSSAVVTGSADGGQQGSTSEGKKPGMNELLRAAAGQ